MQLQSYLSRSYLSRSTPDVEKNEDEVTYLRYTPAEFQTRVSRAVASQCWKQYLSREGQVFDMPYFLV